MIACGPPAALKAELGMRVLELRSATDPFIALSRPIRFDTGERAETISALGQSVCVLSNDKPEAQRPWGGMSSNYQVKVTFG
jgi:hypothetical protein